MQLSASDFANLKEKEKYLKENVLYREVKLEAKQKTEVFKGEVHTRFYI